MKIYIRAMSLERNRAKKQISAYSPILMEHIIKLVMYSDIRPNDVDGWIHTLANWISRADNITLKPKGNKFSESDIVESLFSCMGDELSDYERELYAFVANNRQGKYNHDGKGPYPEFDITYEAADALMNFCFDVMDSTIPLLIDKEDHSLSEYESILRSIFD